MGNLIIKDNALVQASHKLSEVEQRLILLAILKIREAGDTIEACRGREITIHADDYIRTFGVDRQTAYRALKSAVLGVFEAKWGYQAINSRGNLEVVYERFTQNAVYVTAEACVRFRFADAIIPFLVQLEKNFTAYEINEVAKLSSRYSMRLYEMLMQFYDRKNKKGWMTISLADLRFRMGLLSHEYELMSNFKKFVLDLSVKQINEHTHLDVHYTQEKKGRSISGFKFIFEEKKQKKSEPKNTKTPVNTIAKLEMTDKQRRFFADKLSRLSECSRLPGGQESYDALASFIAQDLTREDRASFYAPLLEKIGYKQA